MGLASARSSGSDIVEAEIVVAFSTQPATTASVVIEIQLIPSPDCRIHVHGFVHWVLVRRHLLDCQRMLLFASLVAQGGKSSSVFTHREASAKVRDLEALPVSAVRGSDGVV